jgi:hypothetical protein
LSEGAGLFTGALLLFASQAVAAAEAPGDAPETIIVTGERVKRSLKQTTSSVAVVTQREMLLGFAGVGVALRSRRRTGNKLAQVA